MLKKLLITAIITVLVFSLIGFVGCKRNGNMGQAAFMMDYLNEMLDLTDDQQTLVKQYVKDIFVKSRELKKNQIKVRQAAIAEFKKDSIDQQYLLTLISENKTQNDQMIALVVERLSDFHQMLTPKQREKLLTKIENAKQFRHARMDKMKEFFQQQ